MRSLIGSPGSTKSMSSQLVNIVFFVQVQFCRVVHPLCCLIGKCNVEKYKLKISSILLFSIERTGLKFTRLLVLVLLKVLCLLEKIRLIIKILCFQTVGRYKWRRADEEHEHLDYSGGQEQPKQACQFDTTQGDAPSDKQVPDCPISQPAFTHLSQTPHREQTYKFCTFWLEWEKDYCRV